MHPAPARVVYDELGRTEWPIAMRLAVAERWAHTGRVWLRVQITRLRLARARQRAQRGA